MRARLERHLFVWSKALVGKYRHVVKISERRHGAGFTVRKPVLKLLFQSKFSTPCLDSFRKERNGKLRRGWQNGRHQRSLDLYNHLSLPTRDRGIKPAISWAVYVSRLDSDMRSRSRPMRSPPQPFHCGDVNTLALVCCTGLKLRVNSPKLPSPKLRHRSRP